MRGRERKRNVMRGRRGEIEREKKKVTWKGEGGKEK